MYDIIIGINHYILAILISFYAFIFNKNWLDIPYIFYSFFIIISWTSLNGECLVTYLFKLYKNSDYIPGENVLYNHDFYIIPNSEYYINCFINILMIIWLYGLYIVFTRNKYPKFISILVVFLWLLYKGLLEIYDNHHINTDFHFYQRILNIIFIILLIITIYYTRNKIQYTKK